MKKFFLLACCSILTLFLISCSIDEIDSPTVSEELVILDSGTSGTTPQVVPSLPHGDDDQDKDKTKP